MIDLLCIEHLHPFRANPGQHAICSECGCHYARRAGRHGSQPDVPDANIGAERIRVATLEGRHKVAGERDTWLGDKRKFVDLVMSREPATSERELARYVRAWYGEEI